MDVETLKLTATLAEIAYDRDEDSVASRATSLGCDEITHVGNGGTHAIIVRHGRTTFCLIRGTEWGDLLDVERNFRILPVPAYLGLPDDATWLQKFTSILTCGWVQAGFRSGARQRIEEIKERMLGADEIVIGGHSQGAAVALIVGALVGQIRKENGTSLPEVVGIATPPPGSWGFNAQARRLTGGITLVTNSSDPVCWVPLWFVYPRCTRIHFTTFGEVLVNPSWFAWIRDQPAGLWKFATGVIWCIMAGKSVGVSLGKKLVGRTSHLMSTYNGLIYKIEKLT